MRVGQWRAWERRANSNSMFINFISLYVFLLLAQIIFHPPQHRS